MDRPAEDSNKLRRQRIVAATGVSLALIGLGFVAFHRTRSRANKNIAQARIQEMATSAPKVRTRKFQATVVKTKDHAPLSKVAPLAQRNAEMVVTEKQAPNASNESSLRVVETQPALAGELVFVDTNENLARELTCVSTEPGGYGLLDDDALLARLAPRGVMLIRDGVEREHLVFLNPRDENGFHSD